MSYNEGTDALGLLAVTASRARRIHPRLWWRLLLIVPVVASLWVPSYVRIAPTWLGIPFFYWYLMAWVPASAVCSGIVYYKTRDLV